MSKIINEDIAQMVVLVDNIGAALNEHRDYVELPDVGNSLEVVRAVNRAITAVRNLRIELAEYKKAAQGIVITEKKTYCQPGKTDKKNGMGLHVRMNGKRRI
jgi:hypothetical protein